MTKALQELERLAALDDPEVGHPLADDVLCVLLEQLGCHGVVKAFVKIRKWYDQGTSKKNASAKKNLTR